jgi:hypothetical protein
MILGVTTLKAAEALTITPSQLTLRVTQGGTASRTLLIQSNEPLTGVQILPLDLTNDQRNTSLPAQAIRADLEAPVDLAADALLTVPIHVDLSQVPSGQYSGELLVNYDGGSRPVPVQVAVKDPPWVPLAVLVAGVALGVGVSGYRAKGRPRDEVMVRLGQIRTQMKVDRELDALAQPFKSRIEAELVDVEVALESQQWEAAKGAVDEADAVWTRWRRGRPDWIVQLKAYQRLTERLKDIDVDSHYTAELLQAAEDAHRNAPDLGEPQAFKAKLEPIMARTNTYIELQSRLNVLASAGPQGSTQAAVYRQQLSRLSPLGETGAQQVDRLRQELEGTLNKLRKEQLKRMLSTYEAQAAEEQPPDLEAFQARIEALPPEADGAYMSLHNDLESAMQQSLQRGHPEHVRFEDFGGVAMGMRDGAKGIAPGPATAQLLTGLPSVRVQSLTEQSAAAGRRLRWFTWVTYAIAVILLALAGFVELYTTSLDFGANGVADYFGLLAWGFGAEATRSAISDMVQSWGVVRPS